MNNDFRSAEAIMIDADNYCDGCGKDNVECECGPSAGTAGSLADLVPTNWCDPLLTGKTAVIEGPPFDCQDIERLLRGIKQRIQEAESK